MNCIASQIFHARQMRHITREQLAEKTGLSKEVIYDLENGFLDPHVSTVCKVANALNYSFHIGDVTI